MNILSDEILNGRLKTRNIKTFWTTQRMKAREKPKEYKQALEIILSHSEKLKGEIISELILSKFDGEYTEKFKDLIK